MTWGGFNMIKEYYCPKCISQLEVFDSWGAVSFFCKDCKTLVSRKKILTKEEVDKMKTEGNDNIAK